MGKARNRKRTEFTHKGVILMEKTFQTNELTTPVIEAGNIELRVGESYDLLVGVTAVDSSGKDISRELEVENGIDVHKEGIYSVHYSVRDSSGCKVTKTVRAKVS